MLKNRHSFETYLEIILSDYGTSSGSTAIWLYRNRELIGNVTVTGSSYDDMYYKVTYSNTNGNVIETNIPTTANLRLAFDDIFDTQGINQVRLHFDPI